MVTLEQLVEGLVSDKVDLKEWNRRVWMYSTSNHISRIDTQYLAFVTAYCK
jgi:hypothetical protein